MKKAIACLLMLTLLLCACTPEAKQTEAKEQPTEAAGTETPTEEPTEAPASELTSEPEPELVEPESDYSERWRERPIPESSDLRSVDTDGDGVGDRCYVTPMREQNPFGTCRGFASIAAAEISILGSVLKDDQDAWKTLDLPEKQLAYFSHLAINDPSHPQNGEGYVVADPTDSQQVYTGGSPFLATNAFVDTTGAEKNFLIVDINYGEYSDAQTITVK